MIKKLRKKFIIIVMISVSVVMLLLSVFVNVANFVSVNSELNQTLQMIYQNQGSIPIAPPQNDNKEPDDKKGGPFTKETPFSTRYFVLRYTESGDLVKAELDKIASVTESDTEKYLKIALEHKEGYGYTSGYKFYIAKVDNDRMVAIFLDCYQELRSIYTVATISAIAMVVCIVLVYILVVIFSKKAIDPVVKSARQQKQFITDASHELKTPITVIGTSLTVLEMETGKQKWIDKALTQTEKLKDLVNTLVDLSKMDEDDTPIKLSKFNISEAVSETTESFEDFSKTNNHTLISDIENGIEYSGDEYYIRQLVSILLDNAVKYASDNSDINISLKKGKKGVVIKVDNECEKIEKDDLDKLFDRFYRVDKSRSSGRGFGIGLSMAKNIVEAHKGKISVTCPNDNKIEFTVELK